MKKWIYNLVFGSIKMSPKKQHKLEYDNRGINNFATVYPDHIIIESIVTGKIIKC